MSASHHRRFRHLIAGAVIAASVAGAGCASQRAAQPHIPDESVLDPATSALDKAVAAHANQFAPRIVDAARRRITVARDILFKASKNDRSPTDAERRRVQTLVDQARLDAKAALIKTQAGALQTQIGRLQGGNDSGRSDESSGASSSTSATGGDSGRGLGISSFGRTNNQNNNQGNNTLGGSQ
ncbi:hypothetical protein [Salinisphaera sp.]|uniref:hypothetical protein n=1 Tax=Salinisphaera sp. TaxID=1914330 RepID=UPI002D7958B7|nr:hypothetical protein [Salinisphaera sp.]HET7315595.1 hypothetical protein [Salinisphaera sp.]